MGRYINWPEGSEGGDKRVLAMLCGAYPATYEQAAAVVHDPDKAPLVWINNGEFDALGYAFNEREFQAATLPQDLRPKHFFIVNRAVAEQRAK